MTDDLQAERIAEAKESLREAIEAWAIRAFTEACATDGPLEGAMQRTPQHARLNRAIDALIAAASRHTEACEVCWTASWAPCAEGTPNAVRDPLSGATGMVGDQLWMVCQMCNMDEMYRKLAESAASRPPLFQSGEFALHSGSKSDFKIECDALTDDEWAAIAAWVTLPPFSDVIGVPTGGLKFAAALKPYATQGPTLLVDDVLTTGASMEQHRTGDMRGLVLFARGPVPSWVTAVFASRQEPPAEPDGGGRADDHSKAG